MNTGSTAKRIRNGSRLDNATGPDMMLRRILSIGYAAGRLAHHGVYAAGLIERRRLPCPVICVGNLTVGGTGKTPFLIYLANELKSRGLRPAILSRGYGARPPATKPRVVSDGESANGDPARDGDEPVLLSRSCPDVPVVIGTSRYDAGLLALAEFHSDILLLDDGFQHEPLARDADLVLWDARDIPSQMRQLPAGRLREGLRGLRRASAIIITHRELLGPDLRRTQLDRILRELKRNAPSAPVFEAETAMNSVRKLGVQGGVELPISYLQGRRCLLVSGLARPEAFESMARNEGVDVGDHLRYLDHAKYANGDLETIAASLKKNSADLVLTTEKDAVKLECLKLEGAEFHAASIAMRVDEPERWDPFLESIASRQHDSAPS